MTRDWAQPPAVNRHDSQEKQCKCVEYLLKWSYGGFKGESFMLLLMGDAFQENFTRIRFTKVVFFFEWILSPGCAPVSLLSFYSQPLLCQARRDLITRIPGTVDNPSFTPPPQTFKLHPAAQSFSLTPSERQSLYKRYKKKCIWSLSQVPGTNLLKPLEFPDWGKCLLSFVRSPEWEHSCLC